MKYSFNQVWRLANSRLGTFTLQNNKTLLLTSDGKSLPFTQHMGKYTPTEYLCESKPYYLTDEEITQHLLTRNKRLLDDQIITFDGTTLIIPLESDLKGTLSYRTKFPPRLPTFRFKDYFASGDKLA